MSFSMENVMSSIGIDEEDIGQENMITLTQSEAGRRTVELEDKSKRSNVWIYFKQIAQGCAKCNLCGFKYSYKSSTSNLKKHLRARHPAYYEQAFESPIDQAKLINFSDPGGWSEIATEDFLDILIEQLQQNRDPDVSSKRYFFEMINKLLCDKGYTFTTEQCINKWNVLTRKYFATCQKLQAGENVVKPKFYKKIAKAVRTQHPVFIKRSKGPFEDSQVKYELGEDERADGNEEDQEFEVEGFNMAPENESVNNFYVANKNDQSEEILFDEAPTLASSFIKEVACLREVVSRSLDINGSILKTNSLAITKTNSQLTSLLESIDKREEEKIAIKRQKLEQQSELINQLKIQNSLISKLVDRLGGEMTEEAE